MVTNGARVPEILAPAGSPEAFIAAVNAGADAVYLGGRNFGARMYAANFSPDEMAWAVSYAHLRGARVYVALNILVHDRELPLIAEYLRSLYVMGADAILVQDPGVADMARDLVPGLSMHASTQCSITDADELRWARKAGFERAVLARELSLGEIDRMLEIPQEERPEIEIFAHGALCYAYSGRCLLSSVIGGRSGNRGRCAQPCRKPYSLVTGRAGSPGWIGTPEPVNTEGAYLLSTKDLCTLASLPELLQRPLAALKIEGRMRSAEYVAIAVSRYRKAVDALTSGRGPPSAQDVEDLAVMFSREFTRGYLFGDRGPGLMGRSRPYNQGLFLGMIASCGHNIIRFLPTAVTLPLAGDGLVGIDPARDERYGFVLRSDAEIDGPFVIIRQKTGCRPGMGLYLTRSLRLDREAKKIMARQGPPGKVPLDIDLNLRLSASQPPRLTGTIVLHDGKRLKVSREADFIPGIATSRPTSSEEVERQIRKTGKTVFLVREFSITTPGNLFIPVGRLNQFRREFFDTVEKKILSSYLPEEPARQKAGDKLDRLLEELGECPGKRKTVVPDLAVLCDDRSSADAALEAGCNIVYLEPEPGSSSILSNLLPTLESSGRRGQIAWKWPLITPQDFVETVRPLLPTLRNAGLREIMTESPGTAGALRCATPDIRFSGGSGLNIFNHRSIQAFSGLFDGFTLSPELSGHDISELAARIPDTRIMLSVIVQGNITAMISADSLSDLVPERLGKTDQRFGIRDQTGKIFPFFPNTLGGTQILNSSELCLLDFIPDIAAAGIDRLIIDARSKGTAYAGAMTSVYVDALSEKEWVMGSPDSRGVVADLKPKIRSLAAGGITSGHFLRGLSED
jgi:putative protease